MIRPVALGQTRFALPDFSADHGGVAWGPGAYVVLPTASHLVGFLRSLSREQPLTVALGTPRLWAARLDAGGQVIVISFESRGTHPLDRAAALCRIQGGQLYTGNDQHAVRYRDAGAPLGYDVEHLGQAGEGEVLLYDRPVGRRLRDARVLSFDRLVRHLALTRRDRPEPHPDLYVHVPAVLSARLARLLLGRGAQVRMALLQRTEASPVMGFRPSDGSVLLEAWQVPDGLLALLRGQPRTRLYRRVHERFFVESGREHPLDLASADRLIEGDAWLFFHGDRGEVDEVSPVSAWADASDVVGQHRFDLEGQTASMVAADSDLLGELAPSTGWGLRLIPRATTQGPVVGRLLVGERELGWLARLVYLAPPSALAGCRFVAWRGGAVVLGEDSGDLLPLPIGRPIRRLASRLYGPANAEVRPRVSAEWLDEVFDSADAPVALWLPEGGLRWAPADEVPLERGTLIEQDLVPVEPLEGVPLPGASDVRPSDASVAAMLLEAFR